MLNVVIADDFSGAAELAGVAYQFGLSTEVQLDACHGQSRDVIVVDANSRSLQAVEAGAVMHRIARTALAWFDSEKIADGWIYRKVDSVLRGPLASELEAMRRAFTAGRVVLVNANPRKRRYVQAGCLWVDGRPIHETGFANDPEHPRTTMHVADLLDWPKSDLHFFGTDQMLADAGLCIAEVSSAQEMHAVAEVIRRAMVASGELELTQNFLRFSHKTVLAGAAEFYEAILGDWFHLRADSESQKSLTPSNDVLLISGTSMPAEIDRHAMQVLSMSDMLREPGSEAMSSSKHRTQAEAIHEQFIEQASDLIRTSRFKQIWIEGGRTASTLLRRMGWTRLEVEAVYGDGVVGLVCSEGPSPHIVVKPGSYPWRR